MSFSRIAAATFLVSLLAASFFLPVGEWALAFVDWVRDHGAIGVLALGTLYIVATVGMLPGLILTLAAGFLYGPLWGTALVSPVSVIGASLAFLVGRYLARDWVKARLGGSKKFAAIDSAIEEDGGRVVFLLRLSPVLPFNLLNYALGLTGVSFWKYVAASWVGMMPGTLLYVYLGSTVANLTDLNERASARESPARQWLFWGGLAATLLVTVWITRITKKKLDSQLALPRSAGSDRIEDKNE